MSEAELRAGEALYRQVVEISREAIWIHCDGKIVFANREAVALFDAGDARNLIGRPMLELVHPDDRHLAAQRTQSLLKDRRPVGLTELRCVGRGGSTIVLEVQAVPFDFDGRQAVLAVGRDISDRVRADQALRESEGRFAKIADSLPTLLWMSEKTGTCIFVNRRWLDYTGRHLEQELGRGFADSIHPEDSELIARHEQSMLAAHCEITTEYRLRGRDGRYRWFVETSVPRFSEAGEYLGHTGVLIDIDDKRRLEARMRTILESTVDGLITIDQSGIILTFNGPAERIFGYSAAELLGRNVAVLMPTPYRSQHDGYIQNYLRGGVAKVIGIGREVEGLRKDGSIFPLDLAIGEMAVPDGPREFVGTVRDISERKRLEGQLRQAQKMESIGQLTGGVAHDFNNLLTVILGNAEELADRLESDPALRALADLMRIAAERGAELTRRLLAFARRQALDPQPTDLNALLANMGGLLRRALAEDIEIKLVRGPGLWTALVDATQLESAVLNLCLNARDAMPSGGQLTIETCNRHLDGPLASEFPELRPGEYVMLAVTDSGTGMPPDVAAQAFEPFFTTKEVGRGSGLGLSMVYGFVKQSGGQVKIYSEPGHGTTVKIYLPRSDMVAGEEAVEHRPEPPGSGTILAVEDDELVRNHVAGQLAALGYRVIVAADGPAALAVVRQGQPVDLLFTDVVMPGGMNGGELAKAVHALRPGLPVLFTSGYTEGSIVQGGRLEAGVHLLNKPYRRQELAAKVREALEAGVRRQEPS